MRQEKGFTLIEILISLTILSLIMGVIMGGFRLGHRSWTAGERRLDEQQRLRCVFDILIQDIKSSIRLRKPASGDTKKDKNLQNWPVVFLGEANKITLITTASGIAPTLKKGTLRLVSYYLSQDEDKPGLIMEESPWLYQNPFKTEESTEEEPVELKSYLYSLYPDVVDITFQYYGIKQLHGKTMDDIDADPDWHENWNLLEDIKNGEGYLKELPERVQVTIKRKQKEEESEVSTSFEIPIAVGERREEKK